MDIKKLRQDRIDALNRAKAITTAAAALGRNLNDEEGKAYDAEMAAVAGFDANIKRAEQMLETERTAPAVVAVVGENLAEKKPFANLGEQLIAVKDYTRSKGHTRDPRLFAALGANETIDAEGGFLIAPEFSPGLLQRTFDDSDVLQRVTTRPMNSSRLVVNGIDDSNRVGGPAGAGIQVYRIAEAFRYTRSLMKFRRVELNANKLIGMYYATDEVLEDAPALQEEINDYFPTAFDWKMVNEVFNGSGVGEFLGINVSGATVVVPKTPNQTAATFTTQNATDMRRSLWVGSRKNAAWFVGPDFEDTLWTLTLPNSATGQGALYMPPKTGMNNSDFGMMLGMPVIPIEQTAMLGTQGDVILADLSQYMVGDRSGVKYATSIHVAFDTGEQAFRWTLRNDGQPLWDKPVTQNNSAIKVSPFVTLASRY